MAKRIKARVADYCQRTEYQKEPDMSYNTHDKATCQYISELLHNLEYKMLGKGVACIYYEDRKLYLTSRQLWEAASLLDALGRTVGVDFLDVNVGEVL